MKFFTLFALGMIAGSFITIQSVLNAALGQKAGNLGSVLLLTGVSILVLLFLIFFLPNTADFRQLPGVSEWYLYFGGVLGVAILAAPIFLIPRIGATSTLTALVVGQLVFAVLIDHFGLFSFPKIEITLVRAMGIGLLVLGVYFIKR